MNLACKIGLATVAIAATLAIACTPLGLSEPESTRRPTSTPAPAVPTQIPLYSTMAPTVDPNLFQEIGGEERLSGPAVTEYETGRTLMSNGDYQAAVAAFSRAQIHHGKPSFALESWIGLAFHKLNDHTQVIAHLTVAIAIEDSATNQVNRATSYLRTGRCDLAINDANQALAMTPEYTEASHTDVQAHLVLGGCHIINGNPGLGMFHLQAALEVAKENGYRSGVTAAIHVLIGERQYSNEKYTEGDRTLFKSHRTKRHGRRTGRQSTTLFPNSRLHDRQRRQSQSPNVAPSRMVAIQHRRRSKRHPSNLLLPKRRTPTSTPTCRRSATDHARKRASSRGFRGTDNDRGSN